MYLVFCFNNNPPRCRNGSFCQLFSNSLPHCKNQGIRQPSWPPDQSKNGVLYVAKEKSSPLATVGTTFTSLLADEAAAECGQAGFQASFVFLLSYDDLLGRSLVRFVRLWCVSYKGRVSGWVPDLLILHSVGRRLVSFLGRTGRGGRGGWGVHEDVRRWSLLIILALRRSVLLWL